MILLSTQLWKRNILCNLYSSGGYLLPWRVSLFIMFAGIHSRYDAQLECWWQFKHTNKGIQSFLHSNKKFYHQTRRNKVHQRRRSSKGKDTTCDYIMYISYSVYLTFGAKILGLFGETRKEETIMGTEVEHLGWKRSVNISYEEPGKQKKKMGVCIVLNLWHNISGDRSYSPLIIQYG